MFGKNKLFLFSIISFVKKLVKALNKTLEEEKLAREKVVIYTNHSDHESKECSIVPSKTGINNVISQFWKEYIHNYSSSGQLEQIIKNAIEGYCSAFSYGLDKNDKPYLNIDNMKNGVNQQIDQFIKTMYNYKEGISLPKLLTKVNSYLDDNWKMSCSSITPISSQSTTKKKRDDASSKDNKIDQFLELDSDIEKHVFSLKTLIRIMIMKLLHI